MKYSWWQFPSCSIGCLADGGQNQCIENDAFKLQERIQIKDVHQI
jgi:hypothetical protein